MEYICFIELQQIYMGLSKVLDLQMVKLDRFCSYVHRTSTDNPEGH